MEANHTAGICGERSWQEARQGIYLCVGSRKDHQNVKCIGDSDIHRKR